MLTVRDGNADRIPVVLTIDTEPDNAWENHHNTSVANVQELLRLQELLDTYGAKATCLVTYRVIQDDRAVSVLRQLVEHGGAEIGAHLHPWETPPFMDSGVDVRYQTYPHELPVDVFEQKLTCLTEAIARRFGRPTSYRGGRWGLAAEHLPILERLGYEVDTSVMPLEDWRRTPGVPKCENGRGGIDYRFAPIGPYYPSYESVTDEGDARILELPVSVGFTRRTSRAVREVWRHLPSFLKRGLGKLEVLRPVWAVPAEERCDRLVDMLQYAIGVLPCITIAVHSSELALGGSPRSRTSGQIDEVFRRIDRMLDVLAGSGRCQFRTMSDACCRWRAGGREPAQPKQLCGAVSVSDCDSASTVTNPVQPSETELVYILAASHSGSTLLAMLLGAHSETCTVGELKATSLGNRETYLCSCGVRIRGCEFWREVSAEMARRGVAFDITDAGIDIRTGATFYVRKLLQPLHRTRRWECLRDLLLNLSPTWRANLPRLQRRNRILVETLCHCCKARVIIDSSKIGLRLKYLLQDPELNVKVVRLIRDGRAVALTYCNPRLYAGGVEADVSGDTSREVLPEDPRSMKKAAYEWRRSNEEAECILSGLPTSQWAEVRYEELCAAPEQTLDRLSNFLNLDPERRLRDFRARARHVVGNSMRLATAEGIKLDERWRAVLTAEDLRVFDAVAGRMNRRYGYV